jgi:ADP-ribosyl-[dinitrogen reductase] hydrolase
MIDFENRLKGGIIGACLGDALGVPVEFKSRQYLTQNPVIDMQGYGTHLQPPGTWSDDSSMIFCTIESLCNGYDLKDMANLFIRWCNESFWTPYGVVFDIGITTTTAIIKLSKNQNSELIGSTEENSNGNGSLMRILPLVFFFDAQKTSNRFEITSQVSSITHAHIRSVIACYIYTEFALIILRGTEKYEAYITAVEKINLFLQKQKIESSEISIFERVLGGQINRLTENQISSSGYVIDSLEASIWSFLNTSSYTEAVLKSVNLGGDTDTTASITGGLAGIYYGFESLPKDWIKKLARIKDIQNLVDKFYNSLVKQGQIEDSRKI